MGVLEYVREHTLAIEELVRVLKPGGVVIISLLNKISPYRLVWGLRRTLGRERFPDTMFTEWYCRSLLVAKGLRVVDLLYYDFNVFLPPLDRRYPRRAVRTSEKLEPLSRGLLRWLGTAFLVKAEKIN
jgi:SAM-dependent methyltransferase